MATFNACVLKMKLMNKKNLSNWIKNEQIKALEPNLCVGFKNKEEIRQLYETVTTRQGKYLEWTGWEWTGPDIFVRIYEDGFNFVFDPGKTEHVISWEEYKLIQAIK